MKKCIFCKTSFKDDINRCPKCNSVLLDYENKNNKECKSWYVYVLWNPYFKDYFNIWICTWSIKDLIKRKSQDVPLPYEICAYLKTSKYKEAKFALLYNLKSFEELNGFYKVSFKVILDNLNIINNLLDDGEVKKDNLYLNIKQNLSNNKQQKNTVKRRKKEYESINEAWYNEKLQVQEILNNTWKKDSLVLQAIVESIIANWWEANCTEVIFPYIKKYYWELFSKYKDNERWFGCRITTTIYNSNLFEKVSKWTFKLK